MYNNNPTVHTESLRRLNERRDEERRRALHNKRLIRVAIRVALVVAVAAALYLTR